MDTFGVDALVSGGGVIDIAGGRGMLSLELALTHDVQPAWLVEPKPLRLNKAYQRRVKKWRRRAEEAKAAGAATTMVEGDDNENDEKYLKTVVGGDDDGDDDDDDDEGEETGGEEVRAVDDEDDAAIDARSTATAAEADAGNATAATDPEEEQEEELEEEILEAEETPVPWPVPMPVRHVQAEFHGLDASGEDVVAALRSAGTVLAMHPDYPTGHIVDAAVALGKPFAAGARHVQDPRHT